MFTISFRFKVLRSYGAKFVISRKNGLLKFFGNEISFAIVEKNSREYASKFVSISLAQHCISLHLQPPPRKKGRGLRIRDHCQTFIDRCCFILALNYREKIGVITFVELGQEINSNLPHHHRYKHLFP